MNGDVYKGAFVGGVRTGQGLMEYANGTIYEGAFIDGSATGVGEYEFEVGGVYKDVSGNAEDFADKKMGQGRKEYSNGDVYIGDWKEGKRHGQGRLKYENGDAYIGKFQNNLEHGLGVYENADGTTEKVRFEKGRLEI